MDRRKQLRRIFEGLVPASVLDAAVSAMEASAEAIRAEGEEEDVTPSMFGGVDSQGRGIIRLWGPIVSDSSWDAMMLSDFGMPYSSPGRFGAALAAAREAGATELVLRISSEGGVLAVANSMLMNLREWRNEGGSVSQATLEGWVGSAATVVMLGAERIVCGPLTECLIHFPMVSVMGARPEKLRTLAQALDDASAEVVRLYVSARGLEEDAVRAQMEKDTAIVGQRIVDFGLADAVLEVEPEEEPTMSGPEPPAEPPAVDPPPEPPAVDPPADPPQIQDGADPVPEEPPASPAEGDADAALIGSRLRRRRSRRSL